MIQIPENLRKVCIDNTIKALAMFENTKDPSKKSFDEYQNFYQAKVFLQKFKMDGWLMCYQIWKSVWENLVNDIDIENHNIIYLTTPEYCFDLVNDINDYSTFTVSYNVNQKFDINLCVILYWQEQKIGICSSIDNPDCIDFPIIKTTTKLTAIYQDLNVSEHTVSLKSDTISDLDIDKFRKSAQEIINYFNKHKQEVLSNSK